MWRKQFFYCKGFRGGCAPPCVRAPALPARRIRTATCRLRTERAPAVAACGALRCDGTLQAALPLCLPQAVCNDGTPAAYYLQKGTGSGANRWVLYLEGGFWCWDKSSCDLRYNTSHFQMSSSDCARPAARWPGPPTPTPSPPFP